ncbi:PRTRC system protein E [Bacteroides thetaiotaomicron]|uniref:PRTRC system protein E n=1 Tax=Bacteroides thetaiotaomicron TaxID=818 RepID=UPI001CE313A8|nr:PRTRC system protein E [Bacteroides thetaiotaomicron]MCA5987197.1 PRTRC system protein E [Bacteroides thetaiotaomicron]MCA6040752.1 PRTRC system protein E [Bacteroides thetaiotaomicron]
MFFTAIHQMMTESVDLTIVIRKTNGQLTVSTLPKSNGLKDEAQNHIVPLTVTGTPQELDTGFLQAVTRPIQKACGLISNMAQFEAQADKAAASSKAAKDAKSKETKEEREKREKYEKLMKKAEELTAARNHREAVSVLTQAKAHANAAQLKEIEEKIKAATAEMNKGSLFDLMEQEAQPEQPAYTQTPQTQHPQQPVPQQPVYTQSPQPPMPGQGQTAAQRPPQPAYTQPPMPGQAQPAPQRPQQAYTQQPGIWPPQQQPPQPQARPQIQPHAQYVQRTGGQQPPQSQYPPQPEMQDWQEERLTREDEQQQLYLSDQEYPAYSEKDYEEYVDFPQSMLEPKYSSYQTV